MTSSVIITVVVVLGIIVAGGFLLYFCGDMLMGLAGKKKDADVIKEKEQKEKAKLEARVNALENSEEAKRDPEIAAYLYDGAIIEDYNPDEEEIESTVEETIEKAEEVADETVEENAEETEIEEESEEVGETEVEDEVEETDEEEEDAAEFIRQRRAELMERLARMQAEQNEEEEETDEEEEDAIDLEEEEDNTDLQEMLEKVEESESADVVEVAEKIVESVENVETEEEIEESEEAEEVEEDSAEEDDIAVETEKTQVVGGPLANLTIEQLEARLADEQEKLKDNEKDLRQCKKEYIPLRRVKKTLENDEKKLRRKEALVAKQKVVLYGVNNYADIDEEKAKKLAEDLDLLDGLKLSVQHCQEVMDKNEERYPLLEKIFNLLSVQNEEIKADIKDLQDAIAKLQDVPTDSDAE